MREAVNQCDVQTSVVEKAAEFIEAILLKKFARVAGRQPEPDSKWIGRRQPLLQGWRESLQVRADRSPPLSGMDVRAVGQVKGARPIDLQGDAAQPTRAGCGVPADVTLNFGD